MRSSARKPRETARANREITRSSLGGARETSTRGGRSLRPGDAVELARSGVGVIEVEQAFFVGFDLRQWREAIGAEVGRGFDGVHRLGAAEAFQADRVRI